MSQIRALKQAEAELGKVSELPPGERLDQIAKWRSDLALLVATMRGATIAAIGDARADDPPLQWTRIADKLGVSKQRAIQMYQGGSDV